MPVCPKCGGVGEVEDNAVIGTRMLSLRIAKVVTALTVATRMDISRSYLCDLEKGRRQWTPDLKQRYQDAVDQG
jgi:transcriptional regulator with XRE-family HTH domain